MNAVAKLGPVAVSVAASTWGFYKSGIFDIALNTTKATDVNHLVVLVGYGTDRKTGEDFWLVRNSWGPQWGEKGYIRLKRTNTDESPNCGIDTTPKDGVACAKDDNGNDIDPPPALICGTSGILYDSSVPLGGYLL
jgi:cathepsin L